ncbi:Tetraketide alpha-pyrone reductase 1 [Morella rubra]|uniref:Tetraketide alpha-pyrone reductase 1 n=1 Tax=Morella rubra TaxID=262757 RepID=A0A6A1WKI5_9ROSI|nr:Tetraketide alpha-pyrone reductase 1 [Morella rubra]
MSDGTEKVVCVTGASGYIASWLVKLLLQRGYNVKATVRDPNDPKKTEHLLALDGAKERLSLFKADLQEEGSFDSAIDGCEGVFHTASPVLYNFSDPQAELIDPAVMGTLDVLRSCAKVSSVKRVVVTSSMAAVLNSGRTITSDVVIDETWFSDPAILEKSKVWPSQRWYTLSKTLAEEAAWKFAKENGIDMVTMNPGWVIGPLLQPTVNATLKPILNFVNGAERTLDVPAVWVDVRDIANAHILAYENPSANGRYCLVASTTSCYGVMKILRELIPTLYLPENNDDKPLLSIYTVSKEKAESLGLNFIPLEVTLKDTVESLREKNFVSV